MWNMLQELQDNLAPNFALCIFKLIFCTWTPSSDGHNLSNFVMQLIEASC